MQRPKRIWALLAAIRCHRDRGIHPHADAPPAASTHLLSHARDHRTGLVRVESLTYLPCRSRRAGISKDINTRDRARGEGSRPVPASPIPETKLTFGELPRRIKHLNFWSTAARSIPSRARFLLAAGSPCEFSFLPCRTSGPVPIVEIHRNCGRRRRVTTSVSVFHRKGRGLPRGEGPQRLIRLCRGKRRGWG